MGWLAILVFAVAPLVVVGTLTCALLLWLSGDAPKEDTDIEHSRGLIRKMRRWFMKTTPKLTYRRDSKGRFRKMRRR